MATPIAVPRPRRRADIALVAGSVALLGLQVWNLLHWVRAFGRGGTQAERADLYLHGFPLGVSKLGTSGLSWMFLLVATISLLAAIVVGRPLAGRARAGILLLIVGNALLVLWYLFTLL
ncbi:MAG: hypothetical protein V4503_10955 [Gemmatimonadota bacterium]